MKDKELFLADSIPHYLKVITPDSELLSEVWEESLELQESICSEDVLRYGCCEASVFKLRILNVVTPLVGKKIAACFLLGEENEMQLGKYKVSSDKPTADRRYRDIVAYDAMYDIINADVADWYNTILPNVDSTVTLKEFRTSFLAHFGVDQEDVTLINDSMTVEKTVEPSKLSGKTVITAICEINGCFGHIGRDGKFQYIFLKEMVDGLYPSDTLYPREDLFPVDPVNVEQIKRRYYISATYEDFVTEKINRLQIRQGEDDIGCIYGTGDNCYVVQDNFLLYGKSTEGLTIIAEKLYSVISKVYYRPAHVEAKGNPCLEVGDGIRLATTNEIVRTYILQRTLKGIQALRDTYDAEGEQYQSEDVNSVHESIIQLKGKTNKLSRTLEETRSEIANVEKGLSSQITQNAEQIKLEVSKIYATQGNVQDTADNLLQQMNSVIIAKVDEIRLEVTERTSIYNEQVNTLQGGMEGALDLSFFNSEDGATITVESGKNCIYPGTGENTVQNMCSIYQDVSLPSGTYLFSYEWLRNSGFYINAGVRLYDLTDNNTIYDEDLGYAWPETDVWHKEEFQFIINKTKRIRFEAHFEAPWDYPDRVNSLYFTNIALYGTAQSVSDAIADVKTELNLQANKIEARVEKDGVIASINLTSEKATIQAEKIDLVGLVSAKEFTSKYATITSLNATNANVQNLITSKASVEQLNATNAAIQSLSTNKIDASTVKANYMEVANWTSNGYIKADKIDVNSLAARFTRATVLNVGLLSASNLRVGIYEFSPQYNSTLGCYILKGTPYSG